jgi:17beta-estradiol 17-dehydrogenase / very-long-chain 3-oxoacyl-CoA reductase
VTGGSEGIGLGISQELATRGFNVIISARGEDTLKAACSSIKEINPNIQVEYIVADSSKCQEAVQKLKSVVANKLITILVNNVGVESGEPEPFESKTLENLDRIIDVNIRFSSHLTHDFIPIINKNCGSAQNSWKGAIINLSSVAGKLEVPLLSSYSASKAYNQVFSTSLAKEMRMHGPNKGKIDLLSARPFIVESRMSGLTAESTKGRLLCVLKPIQFAKCTLDKLGHVDDCAPHWIQDLQCKILCFLQKISRDFLYYPLRNKYLKNMKKDE